MTCYYCTYTYIDLQFIEFSLSPLIQFMSQESLYVPDDTGDPDDPDDPDDLDYPDDPDDLLFLPFLLFLPSVGAYLR